jgi:TolA-binding protein
MKRYAWLPAAALLVLVGGLVPRARADQSDDSFKAAAALYDQGDHEGAAKAFRAFLAQYPTDERAAMAAYRVGQCLGKLDQPGEASDAFDLCYTHYGASNYADSALFNKGRYAYAAERWQPAAAAFYDYTKIGKNAGLKGQAWYFRGEALFKLDRADDARTAFESFLASPPEVLGLPECSQLLPYARFNLGVCQQSAGKWEPAVAAFQKLLADFATAPMIDEALFNGGDCLRHLGRADEAVKWLTRVANEFPKSELAPQALARIAAIETDRGRVAAAKDAADRLAKDYPDYRNLAGEGKFRLAWSRLQAKDYEGAEKLYADGLQSATGDQEAIGLAGLAEARFAQGKWPETEAALVLMLQKHPDHPEAARCRSRLVEVYLRENKLPEAEAAARDYLKAAPGGPDAAAVRHNLALSLYRQDRKEEAMKLFDEVVAADPKAETTAPVLLEMGRFGLETKRWADARRAFELFLKFHAERPEALSARYGLGQVAEGENDPAAALVAYRAVADQPGADPLAAEALARMVELYRKLGQEEKAQLAGQELRRRFPTSADAARSLLTAGYEHFSNKRYNDAIYAFEAFLRDHAKDEAAPAALANLAASYYLADKPADHYAKAADAYRRLARDYPTFDGGADALFWAGRASEAAGDDSAAVDAYRGFLAGHAEHKLAPKARSALASLLIKAKHGDQAIKVLTEAVATAPDAAYRAQARYDLAWALLDAGQKDAADQAFAQVSVDLPDGECAPLAEFQLCARLAEQQRYADAITAWRRWIDKYPKHRWQPQAAYSLALAQETAGDFVNAAMGFATAAGALDEPGARALATYHQGYALFRGGDFAAALKTFETYDQQYSQGPQRPEVAFYRGQTYSAQNKWAEAEKAFRQAVRDFPNHPLEPLAQFNLAAALQNQTKYLPAAEAYEPLTLAPVAGQPAPTAELRAKALLGRGECLYAALRYVDALTSLLAAEASGNPDVLPEARYYLGQCYHFQNDLPKAKQRFQQVITEHPGTIWAQKAKLGLDELGG